MSDTYKTKPLRVKFATRAPKKKHDVGYRAVHSHEDGVCDLPSVDNVAKYQSDTKCHYSLDSDSPNVCGCALCTNQFERHQENKSNRRSSKMELRKTLKEGGSE